MSAELKLGQLVFGMTITMSQTHTLFLGRRDGGGNKGLKGAKTIGLCQETLDVQSLPMLVSAAELRSRPEREWRGRRGVHAGTVRGGMFRGEVYL